MPAAACSKLCSNVSAWSGVFAIGVVSVGNCFCRVPYTKNVNRFDKRKWFHIKKRQTADDILQKI